MRPLILTLACALLLAGAPDVTFAQGTAAGAAASGHARGRGRAAKRAARRGADKTVDAEAEDVTDSSHALEPGAWQVEMAWSLQSLPAADTALPAHEVTAPQALVRFGVNRRLELRLSADGVVSDAPRASATPRVTGMSDIELACKIVLRDEGTHGFGVDLIPGWSLPIGSAAFTSGGADPSLTLVWDHRLPAGFDASGSAAVASLTDRGSRFTQTAASLSFGHNLSRGWSAFSDVALFSALTRDGASASFADIGLQHHLGRFSQIAVSVGHRLHGPAPGWAVSVGLAVRTPRHKPHALPPAAG